MGEAAPNLGKPMSGISKLERMKVLILGKVKDFEKRAMLESTTCLPGGQVQQR
jgi:hypothetical protein